MKSLEGNFLRTTAAIGLLAPLLLAGCAGQMPSELSTAPAYLVAVKATPLPHDDARMAHYSYHTWFDLKDGGEDTWQRVEILFNSPHVLIYSIDSKEAHNDQRWNGTVNVVGYAEGEKAQAMIPKILAEARAYDSSHYREWPGPNSNTFVAQIARDTPGLSVNFFHNALGKDYTPSFYAGPSASGTGLQADTCFIGVEAGVTDGLELHFLQTTAGISLFPPAIDLPLLPRIGLTPRGN